MKKVEFKVLSRAPRERYFPYGFTPGRRSCKKAKKYGEAEVCKCEPPFLKAITEISLAGRGHPFLSLKDCCWCNKTQACSLSIVAWLFEFLTNWYEKVLEVIKTAKIQLPFNSKKVFKFCSLEEILIASLPGVEGRRTKLIGWVGRWLCQVQVAYRYSRLEIRLFQHLKPNGCLFHPNTTKTTVWTFKPY